jgi:magnesium-protoporphyrin IX monomethyl ester (oxidative) cyclase
MRAILINPPDNLERFLGKGKNFVPILEPLGLLYIAAVCKRYGYNISVIDAFAEKISAEQLKAIIAKEQPDVVGFTSFVSNGDVIYELGRWIKSEFPKIVVVFGNVQASVYAESYLRNNCCHIVVHGEGEFVFLNLLNILRKKQNDFSNVPSISYLENGKFITTSGPTIVENLSELPFPDRDALNQKLYNIPAISNMPYIGRKNCIGKHMFTSRGCPFSCTFCVVPNKRNQRFNSIDNVVNEIEVLIKKYSADYIFIMDPIFISNKKRVIDICKDIKRRKLNFKWGCEGHIGFIDQELVEEMESAGCYDISFGIESGVQRLLDIVKKGNCLGRIEEAIKTVKNNTEIKVSGLFILGLPGEAYQDTLQTINFAKRLPLDMAQFSILVPYPGSPIFYELSEKGEIDIGLREDGTLDTSVWLRYSPYVFDTVNDPIWVTPDLTSALLKRLQKKALREFYFRPKQFCSQLNRLRLSNLQIVVQTFLKTFF